MNQQGLIYVVSAILLFAVIVYRQYNDNQEQQHHDDIVRRYLVNKPTLAQSKKPFLWIHTVFEPNSRHWVEFGSRMTTHMNQPYKFMAIKSVIDHCAKDFNICLLNDDSFAKILPGWNIDMDSIAEPIKGKVRRMALVKTLREYGGLIVPDSFVCSKNLLPIIQDRDAVVCGMTSPALFMGAPAQHEQINAYAKELEKMISSDYTAESLFYCEPGAPSLTIPSNLLGLTDTSRREVTLDRLMGSTFIHLDCNTYGIYIPDEELLRSTKYQWFARLSAEQVLKSDTFAGKYFLINQEEH